jgi:solute carrier family 25, member 38
MSLRSVVSGGRREMFRGFYASAMRDAPYAGIFMLVYERAKRLAEDANASVGLGRTASAAAAGAVATATTHPFDVIKTKIQVRPEARYQSVYCTVKSVWMECGMRGFVDGMLVRMSRKVVGSSLSWVVYEYLIF